MRAQKMQRTEWPK